MMEFDVNEASGENDDGPLGNFAGSRSYEISRFWPP
jgi:hypothetical protein